MREDERWSDMNTHAVEVCPRRESKGVKPERRISKEGWRGEGGVEKVITQEKKRRLTLNVLNVQAGTMCHRQCLFCSLRLSCVCMMKRGGRRGREVGG